MAADDFSELRRRCRASARAARQSDWPGREGERERAESGLVRSLLKRSLSHEIARLRQAGALVQVRGGTEGEGAGGSGSGSGSQREQKRGRERGKICDDGRCEWRSDNDY